MVRLCALLVVLWAFAGCSGGGGKEAAAPLTADPKLNSCLAQLRVTRCNLASVPADGPVKARATLAVRGEGGTGAPGSRSVTLRVYDPSTGETTEPDSEGNLLVPLGGTLLALGGSGGAALWYFDHKKGGGGDGDVEIDPGEDVPLSVRTNREPDPGSVSVTARTPGGKVDCTPVAVAGGRVLATAPFGEQDAGPVTVTAGDAAGPAGSEEMDAVLNRIFWTPELVPQGETGTLSCVLLPASRQCRLRISVNAQSTPALLKPGQITGSPGQWVLIFEGNAGALSQGGLFTAQATTPNGIEAGAQVEELP